MSPTCTPALSARPPLTSSSTLTAAVARLSEGAPQQCSQCCACTGQLGILWSVACSSFVVMRVDSHAEVKVVKSREDHDPVWQQSRGVCCCSYWRKWTGQLCDGRYKAYRGYLEIRPEPSPWVSEGSGGTVALVAPAEMLFQPPWPQRHAFGMGGFLHPHECDAQRGQISPFRNECSIVCFIACLCNSRNMRGS